MAIVVTNRDVGAASSPGASKVTNSVAFQNNCLYIVTFSCRGGTNPDTTALTGGGITWAKTITSKTAALMFMSQWWGLTTSGASTGTLTATISGSPTSFKWVLDEFAGVNTTTPWVTAQTTAWSNGSNGNGLVTLPNSFGDGVSNVAYGVFATNQSVASAQPETSITPEGGWTQLAFDNSTLTSAQSITSQYRTGEDLTATATFASAPANVWAGNGFEIQMAAAAAVTRALQVNVAPQRW